jgi:hypothetical protein
VGSRRASGTGGGGGGAGRVGEVIDGKGGAQRPALGFRRWLALRLRALARRLRVRFDMAAG